MIKNLVLDMGNVLLGWEPQSFALRAAGNGQDAEVLYTALFDAPEWRLCDAGQIEEVEALRVSLARVPRRLHSAMQTLFAQWPGWMPPVPGADAFTARAIKAGLRLYLLSNAGKRFPRELEAHGFFARFSGAVVSAHEKVSKPDVRIYQILCERYTLAPGECLFVDDIAENVEGAIKAGMAACLFDGGFGKVETALRALGTILPEV